VTADLQCITVVALVGRHELDAAVAVPMVVPVDKRRHPLAGLLLAGKWPSRVVRAIFRGAEQRLGIEFVVRYPWPREGSQHAQLFHPALQRGRTHRNAVIRVEDQRLLPAFADPLSQAGPAHQIRCNGGVFSLGDIPGHHLAAPDADHQVEVQPDPAHGGGEIGDIPAPHLIRA